MKQKEVNEVNEVDEVNELLRPVDEILFFFSSINLMILS